MGEQKDMGEPSIEVLEQRAQKGDLAAKGALGIHYVCEESTQLERGLKLVLEAAEGGHAPSQVFVGMMQKGGFHLPEDHREALRWFQRAIEQGDADGKYQYGKMICDGIVTQPPERGLALIIEAANGDSETAQVDLGYRYIRGDGVAKDWKQSVKWFERASALGFSEGSYMLGILLEDEALGAVDPKRGLSLVKDAACDGYHEAQYDLACRYRDGNGVEVDLTKATDLFRQAAEQDNEEAQYCLAVALYDGAGVPMDEEEGLSWIKRSAELGDEDAIGFLRELKDSSSQKAPTENVLIIARIRMGLAALGTGLVLFYAWTNPPSVQPLLVLSIVGGLALLGLIGSEVWLWIHPDSVKEGDWEKLIDEAPGQRRRALRHLTQRCGRFGVCMAPLLLERVFLESGVPLALAALWAAATAASWSRFLEGTLRLFPLLLSACTYSAIAWFAPRWGLWNPLAFLLAVNLGILGFMFYVQRSARESVGE